MELNTFVHPVYQYSVCCMVKKHIVNKSRQEAPHEIDSKRCQISTQLKIGNRIEITAKKQIYII